MGSSLRIAVVGATGLVGREVLNVLHERSFEVGELLPLASERSAGERIEWGDQSYTVGLANPAAFKDVDIVIMSAGGATSAALAPAAAEAGAVVIDNSSHWRMDPDVPLVVPEVNSADIGFFTKKRIIANPNCSTIQMVVALAPLHRKVPIRRIVVATYQAVSGKGKNAMDELGTQVTDLFAQREIVQKEFTKRIAFNCIPHIDVFLDDGYTKEEHKMIEETRKILHAPSIGICPTCVRVPVFNGHAESLVVEFEQPLSAEDAIDELSQSPGIVYTEGTLPNDDNALAYATQVEVEGTDATYVSRVRNDPSAPNSISMWCVADNLRKGAATNAVQIAEILARDYLQKSN